MHSATISTHLILFCRRKNLHFLFPTIPLINDDALARTSIVCGPKCGIIQKKNHRKCNVYRCLKVARCACCFLHFLLPILTRELLMVSNITRFNVSAFLLAHHLHWFSFHIIRLLRLFSRFRVQWFRGCYISFVISREPMLLLLSFFLCRRERVR